MRRTISVAALVALGVAAPATAALPRSVADRPDDWGTRPQVHALYVVPSDGTDRALDTNGTIEASVDSFQRWLASQAGGRSLRMDTAGGALDVTFHRLARSDAAIAASRAFVRDEIERDLRAAGQIQAGKLYAVYYDGSSTFACGGGAWPPSLPGSVAALYLRGRVAGFPACDSNVFAPPGAAPQYWEFSMVHELIHTMGFVATCAPHHTLAGHTSDDPRDLMYAGPLPWAPALLDVGRDDYFGHANGSCLDFEDSVYLAAAGETPPAASARIVSISAVPARPRAGGRVVVRARLELGGPAGEPTVACSGRITGRALRLVARAVDADEASCTFAIPRSARGKLLSARVTVTKLNVSASRTIRVRVRR